jgi:hypothetical protein
MTGVSSALTTMGKQHARRNAMKLKLELKAEIDIFNTLTKTKTRSH